jgi:hypothetical protein
MPVGCIHHFIVVKRSAVSRVLDKAVTENDQDRIKFSRLMLSMVHSDLHLIAIEDMGGSDSDLENLKYLGLDGHDGKEWLDYYAPHIAKLPANWLLYAPIRELRKDDTHGQVIWSGYKHIDDQSTTVNVWKDEDYPAKSREPFPQVAKIAC